MSWSGCQKKQKTEPEKQLREDLMKKKKAAVNTLVSSSIQGKAREF